LLQEEGVFLLSPESAGAEIAPQALASNPQCVASAAGWATLLSRLTGEVEYYHDVHPLRQGMPREALKSRLKLETRLFNEALARASSERALVEDETTVRLPDHAVRFRPDQQEAIDRLLRDYRRAPYTTPSYKDSAAAVGEDVLLALVEIGQLVRLGPDVLLLPDTYSELVDWVKEYITKNGSVNVGQVRDGFNTSRKYALALLEYLDDQRITKRVGDERVLR